MDFLFGAFLIVVKLIRKSFLFEFVRHIKDRSLKKSVFKFTTKFIKIINQPTNSIVDRAVAL